MQGSVVHPLVGRVGTLTLIDGDTGAAVGGAALTERVSRRLDDLGLGERSVVVLGGDRSVEWVVTYLALHLGGHVPLLAGDRVDELAAAWPAAHVVRTDDGVRVEPPASPGDVDLHPDLALLLSTSGSSGAPKLVRLSHRNLSTNAAAITHFLGLTPVDVGITSLPLHYCYGLSVLHAHLHAGASLVVAAASVVDPCFVEAMRRHRVTNLAGVPHTFDLLDRAGTETALPASVRLLTQAGGRMRPDAVLRWAAFAEARGTDFVVMYGQTEATARIAYLPSHLASSRPASVGVPIADTVLEVCDRDGRVLDAGAVGELVVRGPGVMMGYASTLTDLADGPTLGELRTGDLARIGVDGLVEIVGRASRTVKPFGLRLDLDHLERVLTSSIGGSVGEIAVGGDDRGLVIAFTGTVDRSSVRRHSARASGLPLHSIAVEHVTELPRTTSGKVDHGALSTLSGLRTAAPDRVRGGGATGHPIDDAMAVRQRIAAVYRRVLAADDVDADDSFVGLGGDSLAYVECSLHLERILGRLPSDWHLRPVRDLAVIARPQRRWAQVDTTVVVRAIGITLVVSTHMGVWHVPGGAHTLLAIVGYNVARFLLPVEAQRERWRAGLHRVGRVALPTMAWTALGMVLFGAYSPATLLLVNNYAGVAGHDNDHWHFWFIEVLVHLVLVTTALLAIPAVRRLERRHHYLFPLGLLALTLVLRAEWAQMGDWYNLRFRTHAVAWFFVLGWLAAQSSTTLQRWCTSLVCVVAVPGFFRNPARESLIIAAVLIILWRPTVPMPRTLSRPVGAVASASMWILISHFSVWPVLDRVMANGPAMAATMVTGVLLAAGVTAVERHGRRARRELLARWRSHRGVPTSSSWTPPPTSVSHSSHRSLASR